jgi:hypothetical protein
MIERRRRPFACDFKSDTATFYRCPWELYSQETLSETHRVWETILGSSRRADLVSAASPKRTLIELEPTKHPPSLSYGAAGAN